MGAGAVFVVECVTTLLLWAPIPLGWIWIGGQVFRATGSLMADATVAFLGFTATTVLVMRALISLDLLWITLRQHAGHEQKVGALTRVVIGSTTLDGTRTRCSTESVSVRVCATAKALTTFTRSQSWVAPITSAATKSRWS